MDGNEFYNAYIENLLADIAELNKLRIMMKTQMDMMNKTMQHQAEKIKQLEASSLDKPDPPEEKTAELF